MTREAVERFGGEKVVQEINHDGHDEDYAVDCVRQAMIVQERANFQSSLARHEPNESNISGGGL